MHYLVLVLVLLITLLLAFFFLFFVYTTSRYLCALPVCPKATEVLLRITTFLLERQHRSNFICPTNCTPDGRGLSKCYLIICCCLYSDLPSGLPFRHIWRLGNILYTSNNSTSAFGLIIMSLLFVYRSLYFSILENVPQTYNNSTRPFRLRSISIL